MRALVYHSAFAGSYIIYVYFGVCGESIFLSCQLAAGICDESAVRTPAKLLDSAERLRRKFVKLIFSGQDVGPFLDCTFLESEIAYEGMRNLHHGVVPMTVHQVVCRICIGLVQVCIAVRRRFDRALDIADIHNFLLVWRELELADAALDVADLLQSRKSPLSTFLSYLGRPYLSSHQKYDPLSVCAPSRIAYASAGFRKLPASAVVDVAQEEIAYAPVLGRRGVAHSI